MVCRISASSPRRHRRLWHRLWRPRTVLDFATMNDGSALFGFVTMDSGGALFSAGLFGVGCGGAWLCGAPASLAQIQFYEWYAHI